MEMEIAKYLLSALLGCCAGSFLCLCADRFQRDESIFLPRSHCAGCGHPLAPRDLVSLLSYLCQRGRCRYCGRKLPFSLFWREAMTGCFFLLAAWLPGSLPLLGVRWLSLSLLLLLSWLDMEELQLYEELFYPLGILFLVLRILKGQSLLPGLAGAVLLGGFLQLIRRLSPRGMGEGDPKLAAVLGLWLGPIQGFRSFFLAMGTALFFVLVKGIRAREDRRAKMREPVPLAPFFCGCGLLLQVLELAGPMDFGLEPGMVPFLGMLELESFPGREKMEQIGRWLRRKLEPWPDQLLGAQLGKDEVTLVQVRRKDAVWEVERALELSWPERIRAGLGRRQTEDAVLWLREICAKRGFTVREAALSLGMDLMAFRELSLPGLSFQEQQEAAPWEILQQIPYEPGTFQLALAPFPEHPETLLAGAVPDEVLAACRALAEGMEWHILRLEAAPQVWGRWLEKETAPFLLVLSGNSLQGAWYEGGRLLGACRLDQGAAGTDEVTEEREAIFRQLWEKAGPTVGERFQEGPSAAFIAGGSPAEQEAWLDYLQSLWDCPATRLGMEPFCQWAPYYEEGKDDGLSAGLGSALGSILPAGEKGNFCYAASPGSCFLEPELWNRVGKVLLAGSLALCLVGVGARILVERNLGQCRQQLRQASGWEQLRREQQEAWKKRLRQENIQKELARRRLPWGEMLTLLGRTFPASCWLTQVEQHGHPDGPVLLLEGKTLERESFFQLVRRLRQHPQAAGVGLERLEYRGDTPGTEDFVIRLQWKGENHGT